MSDKALAGQPASFLVGAAIGSGNMALAAERGGADFLLAINAGRLRTMGAPSIACMLPILDANPMTWNFACQEVLTQCRIPVFVGISVWEKELAFERQAQNIREMGFAGAVNFPSCMHYSRPMQQLLARSGRGIEQEVEALRAVQDVGLQAMFYCATRTQARLAADAGISLICLNLGWNVGGAQGHRRRASLEEVAVAARDIGRLIRRINPSSRFLLEGGPIATAEDLGRILGMAEIDGYVGGSTFERMPLEVSVADQIDRFRQAGARNAVLDQESEALIARARGCGMVGRSPPQIALLRRLASLSAGRGAILIAAEPGLDVNPAIRFIARAGNAAQPFSVHRSSNSRRKTPTTVHIDVAGEDFPARARSMLFGNPKDVRAPPPMLGDDKIDILIIHGIERMHSGTQRRLARAIRDGAFRASASRTMQPVYPRIIFTYSVEATRSGGGHLGADGTVFPQEYDLNADLVEVLAGQHVRLPPLRDRIPDLIELIDVSARTALGYPLGREDFSVAAFKRLQAHLWPRNEDEMALMIGGLAGRAAIGAIQPEELKLLQDAETPEVVRVQSEKDRIVDALWRHGYRRGETAQALGMSRKTLYNKIQKFGLSG